MRLQNGNDPECKLFQKIAEEGHYAGRTFPDNTRQGTYCLTPSGKLLASINTNDPREMQKMLEQAINKWNSLSKSERLMKENPRPASGEIVRTERFYPDGGIVLKEYCRDLPRNDQSDDWRGLAWNQDYAWFKKSEVPKFLPGLLEVGAKTFVEKSLIRRLARCHLIDGVRGPTIAIPDSSINLAWMTSEVTARFEDMVILKFEGQVRTKEVGVWAVQGYADVKSSKIQNRGTDLQLLGKARYSLRESKFYFFELIAIGTRWGGTQFNGRYDDLMPAPIGFGFTLAGESQAERVAPAHFASYNWK